MRDETARQNEEQDEGGVWIACRQRDGSGAFLPLPLAWTIRSEEELPTERALAEVAAPVLANVALPGGESGEVAGYITGDGDLYVRVPEELIETLLAAQSA
jgi:hypothetical protein